jgi:serine/threonine protein kinase
MIVRRHHCRSCGRIFYSACSSNRVSIPDIGYLSSVRVCDLCQLKTNAYMRYVALIKSKTNSKASNLENEEDYYVQLKRIANALPEIKSLDYRTVRYDFSVNMQAVHSAHGPVLLKCYHPWMKRDVKELNNELTTLKQIDHPNVSKILDESKNFQEFPFIIYAQFRYGNLTEYCLHKPNKISFQVRIHVLLQLIDVIEYLHVQLKIMHNNLCAENLSVIADLDELSKTALPNQLSLPLIQLADFISARPIQFETDWRLYPKLTHAAPEILTNLGLSTKQGGGPPKQLRYNETAESYAFAVTSAEVFGRCDEKILGHYPRFAGEIIEHVVEGSLRPNFYYLDFPNEQSNDSIELSNNFKDISECLRHCLISEQSARPTTKSIHDILLRALDTQPTIEEFDVFLSHNHGVNGSNHLRVKEVNLKLRDHGFSTWLDEEQLRSSTLISQQLYHAIDQSSIVVIFITKEYMNKVNSDNRNDYCWLEFYTAKKLNKKIIGVLMEPEIADPRTWVGEFGVILGSCLYLNFNEEERTMNEINNLLNEKE